MTTWRAPQSAITTSQSEALQQRPPAKKFRRRSIQRSLSHRQLLVAHRALTMQREAQSSRPSSHHGLSLTQSVTQLVHAYLPRGLPSPLATSWFQRGEVAGCLTHCAEAWQRLCLEEHDILPAVIVTFGLNMQPSSTLPRCPLPHQMARPQRSPIHQRWLEEQIPEWARAGVIQEVTDFKTQVRFMSPIFVVDKKHAPDAPFEKHYRFILDLRALNEHYAWQKGAFKLEDLRVLRDILLAGHHAWGVTLDCESGYWQIPLAEEMARLMAFCDHRQRVYRFRVLPFGLAIAPWVFVRLFRPVLSRLRARYRVEGPMYLDDLMIVGTSKEVVQQHLAATQQVFTELGIRLSPKTSQTPSQVVTFLGVDVDIPSSNLYTTTERQDTIVLWARSLMLRGNQQLPIASREVARFLGLVQSCQWGTRAVNFLLAPLRRWWTTNFDPQHDPY